ncbi:homoserine kinase [Candidatus Burkholderia verschuerenii]|uniref:Hydroxylysine kinase n=1 Tax=Candidatus Burkholderia verschuerenii TaxID=242163 RepID=A0A0L0M707_9BURK|nr:phosphotransferase [Candidatus Burkholderia verschuerenii]KND58452.1 homoserine kinase [Candidatus Burkholderia verschuerenii]
MPADTKPIREFQSGVLRHIEASDPTLPVPRLIPTLAGHDEFSVSNRDGEGFFGSLVSFLQGDPAAARPSTRQRRINFGRTLAQLDDALAGYTHPSDRRVLCWDLMHAAQLLDIVGVIEDSALRRSVAHFLERFDVEVRPQVEPLRTQIIHNDANNNNLLLNPSDSDSVSGIIDFGDMVRAPLVNEVAVCASYELHGDADPIGCILDVIEGYAQRIPLFENEIRHVFDLVLARLAIRLLITNWRAQRYPDNRPYILRNTLPARHAFELLASVPSQK